MTSVAEHEKRNSVLSNEIPIDLFMSAFYTQLVLNIRVYTYFKNGWCALLQQAKKAHENLQQFFPPIV